MQGLTLWRREKQRGPGRSWARGLLVFPILALTAGDSNTARPAEDQPTTVLPGDASTGEEIVSQRPLHHGVYTVGSYPELLVLEPTTGSFFFRGLAPAKEAQVAGGAELRFAWSATSDDGVEGFSWGVDITNPSPDDSQLGWSPWTLQTTTGQPLVFPGNETHSFHVRVRDTDGSVTIGTLVLDVIEMTFQHEILLVDDSFDDTYPNDSQNDAFWNGLVSAYAESSGIPLEGIHVFEAFGAGDREYLNPNVPTLAKMGNYRLLIWDCRGYGYNGRTALLGAAWRTPRLRAYLNAGGRLWLGGRSTIAATLPSPSGLSGDFVYPKTELGPGDFASDYLKLHTSRLDLVTGANQVDKLHSVRPIPGQPAQYESLVVDLSSSVAQRQVVEVVFDPIFAESEPGFRGNIDSVYVYGAVGNELLGENSIYHGKLCALRWSDPDPDRLHGRVQWFGFSLYHLGEFTQAEQVFQKSVDWFREEDIPVPVVALNLRARREGETVVVAWEAGRGDESVPFLVYREEPGGERKRLTPTALTGRLRHEFVDEAAPPGAVSYWIAELDRAGRIFWHGPVSVGPRPVRLEPLLVAVHPNPVIGHAQVAYSVPAAGWVTLTVHDVAGRRVTVLVDANSDPGRYTVPWHPDESGGTRLASGFYLIRLETGGAERVDKVLLLR